MLFTPYFSGNRGNSTTTKRIVDGLLQKGVEVHVFAYEEDEWSKTVQQYVEECDLIHVIHFYRFSEWLHRHNIKLTKPYILTSGGTDVNHYIFQDTYRDEMNEVLKSALAITVFTDDAKEKMFKVYNQVNLYIEVIPQSIWFPQKKGSSPPISIKEGEPTILLPSGLRAVKDVFYLINELEQLKDIYPKLQFLITGMVLEQDIFIRLQQLMEQKPWIHFIENVPLEDMPSVYSWADYVLNTSISEGQSSALLEAMDSECVVLARTNPGNASIIRDGENGFLFSNGTEFIEKFEKVHHDKDLQRGIVANAKRYIQEYHSFDDEINAYLSLYKKYLTTINK